MGNQKTGRSIVSGLSFARHGLYPASHTHSGVEGTLELAGHPNDDGLGVPGRIVVGTGGIRPTCRISTYTKCHLGYGRISCALSHCAVRAVPMCRVRAARFRPVAQGDAGHRNRRFCECTTVRGAGLPSKQRIAEFDSPHSLHICFT